MKSHNNNAEPIDRALCNICSKYFANKYKLKYHKQAVHSEEIETNQLLSCKVCLESFSNKYLLKQHKKSHAKDKVFCNLCSKLKLKATFKTHMKNIHGENTHIPCSTCGLNFRMYSIDKHQKLCNNTEEERAARKAAKAKKCERCGKVLSNIFRLRNHMKICAE